MRQREVCRPSVYQGPRLQLTSNCFFVTLVSPKFLDVPLGVGGLSLGYEERRCWANCSCIRPVKKLSGGMLAWLSGMRCRLVYSPAYATALTVSCSSKSRLVLTFLVLPFWYLLTRVVLDIL